VRLWPAWNDAGHSARESSRVIGGMHEGRLAPEAQNQWGGIPLSSDHSNDFNRLASY